MPKHKPEDAKKAHNLIKKTASIRKSRPGWAAGFATGTIEGGEYSAAVALKLAKARSEIRERGFKNDRAVDLKHQTAGYVWYEQKTIFLAMQTGSFETARKALLGYLGRFGLKPGPVEQAAEIPAAALAQLEDEDAAQLKALADAAVVTKDDEVNEVDEDRTAAEMNQTAAALETPSEPVQQAPVEAQVVVLSQPEQARAQAAATQVSSAVRAVLKRVLGDLPEMQELGDNLQRRMMQRMSQMPPDDRAALLDAAPARLLLEVTRAAVLGWTNRRDAPDVLQTDRAVMPVAGAEVTDHYVDLGNRVIARHAGTRRVSRPLIENRVGSRFDDGGTPEERFASVERLTKALLPALIDRDRLSSTFGVTPVNGIEDLPPGSLGLASVRLALTAVLDQIDACRDAHSAALEAEGSTMSTEDAEGFDAAADDLLSRTEDFISAAEAATQQRPLSAQEADTLTRMARTLQADIVRKFQGMDSCPPAFAPTAAARTFGTALGAFAADVKKSVVPAA